MQYKGNPLFCFYGYVYMTCILLVVTLLLNNMSRMHCCVAKATIFTRTHPHLHSLSDWWNVTHIIWKQTNKQIFFRYVTQFQTNKMLLTFRTYLQSPSSGHVQSKNKAPRNIPRWAERKQSVRKIILSFCLSDAEKKYQCMIHPP